MAIDTVDVALGTDADCGPCARRLRDAMRGHPGVQDVHTVRDDTTLRITVDRERCGQECLTSALNVAREDLRRRFAHRELAVVGMDCTDCASRIEHAVARLPGIDGVTVSVTAARMRVELDTDVADLHDVRRRIRMLGYGIAEDTDPASAGQSLPLPHGATDQRARAYDDGCCSPTSPAHHEHDREPTSADDRSRAASVVQVAAESPLGLLAEWTSGSDRVSRIAGTLLLLAGLVDLTRFPGLIAIVLYAAATLSGGVAIAWSGIRGARATRRPDMNLLMAIAVVGAVAIGAWLEAALVVVLFSIGELLQRRAVGRARRELEALVSLAPALARVWRTHHHAGGVAHHQEVEVPVAELKVEDLVVVLPGEQVPADGRIVEGSSAIDQAAITGESTPVDREPGEQVFAGTLNGEGRLLVRTTSAPGDTTLDRIARLVADAQSRRSPSERWVQAFARIYTPVVIVLAVLVTTVPPALGLLDFSAAFYSALALLILACPCALVLCTPVTIVSALGRASAAGVLIKGGAHLERAAVIDTVAFDKTGTLTAGRPEVVQIETVSEAGGLYPPEQSPLIDQRRILAVAAALERGSAHPLAQAIVAAAERQNFEIPVAHDLRSLTGLGAQGTIAGALVRVGTPRLLASDAGPIGLSLAGRLQRAGRTAVLVEYDGTLIGSIGLADQPRPEAAQAIAQLHALGITDTVMLTGDTAQTARSIAATLGISAVSADLMPEDKAHAVRGLGQRVAMVGDGVNDTPALAAADLAIAMGGAGSPAAVEIADVALMGDDPRKVAGLIGLARWTRTVVRQNIAFSLGTKLIAAIFLLFGALPLWAAVGVDVGASLLVVANGLRLVSGQPFSRTGDTPILSAGVAAAPIRYV